MESAENGSEYTLMVEYDFSKPIDAAIIFDSDEDGSNEEMNTVQQEKNGDHGNVNKYLDMPSLDGHNPTKEIKLDDVVTGMITKYMCETKKICDKKQSEAIKKKLSWHKVNNIKEVRSQHNKSSPKITNIGNNNCQLASFPTEATSGLPSNTPHDMKSQNDCYNSSSPSNASNEQPISAPIEINTVSEKSCNEKHSKRKSSTDSEIIKNKLIRHLGCNNMTEIQSQNKEFISSLLNNSKKNSEVPSFSAEPSGPASGISNNIRNQNNSLISGSPPITTNEKLTTDPIEPIPEPVVDTKHSCCSFEEIGSQQNTLNFSCPPNANNSQPISTSVNEQIESKRESVIIASEITMNPHDTSTSSSSMEACNGQPILSSMEIKTELIDNSNPQNNVSDEATSQLHIILSTSSSPNNENKNSGSAGVEQTDISEEMRSCINVCNSNSSTNTITNITEWLSTDNTLNMQTQQNDSSRLYGHLKPLLDTVSEHLILIWKRVYNCNDVLRGAPNKEFIEDWKKQTHRYKIRLFDLSYSTVVNIILPRAYNKTFVKDFIDNTVLLSKSETRQTTREISLLYLEMMNWVVIMKKQIASELVFNREISHQPLASTSLDIGRKSNNPNSTYNYYKQPINSYPIDTTLPCYRRDKPPPYSNNLPPHYINTIPTQTHVNNHINPGQPGALNNPHRKNQKETRKVNQIPQVTVAEVTRSAVNRSALPQQSSYLPNTTINSVHRPDVPQQNLYLPNTTINSVNRPDVPQQNLYLPNTTINSIYRPDVPQQNLYLLTKNPVTSSSEPRQDLYTPNKTKTTYSNNNYNVNGIPKHDGANYQNYQPIYFNANQAPSADCLSVTNSYPRTAATTGVVGATPTQGAESDYQKFLNSAYISRNCTNTSRANEPSSQNKTHCYRGNDALALDINYHPNNNYLNQANNSHIQQEPDRSSISRDSGFYSPRDFEQQEPSTSPLITHVTSLHPDAVNITEGNCQICGKNTNQKCVGCYSTYYCSYGCQSIDWRKHMAYCNTNQELRRLLSMP